jgi:hypothetical protein
MKRIVFFLLVFFSLTHSQAQEKFSIGIKIGQNFTSVNDVATAHNTASYHAGVNAYFGLNEKTGFAPEIILSQTKLETSSSIASLMMNSLLNPETYHLSYLSIPLLLQLKPFKKLALQAGPQYSVLLDQKKDGLQNASMAFKNGEFAMVGGAKVDLGGFFVYGRYVVGLQDINEVTNQKAWKTTQWQLGLGMNLINF